MINFIKKLISKFRPIKYGKFGYIVYEDKKGIWRWKDTDELMSINRPCRKCKMLPLENGEDPCLGVLEGVQGACCGHGKYDGYIWFNNNKRIIFKNAKTMNG